jgi:two-component system CheB/CheR fusion protein
VRRDEWHQALEAVVASDRCDIPDGELSSVIDRLRRVHAVDFAGHKQRLLRTQIAARMATRCLSSTSEYVELLEASVQERAALLEGLLIGSTSFFRDPDVFAAIRAQVLPRIVDPNHRATLRVWVPGCSTGEEAYSLGMLLWEYLDEAGDARPLRVFATDVHDGALACGRRGVYGASAMAGLSEHRRERFFEVRSDGSFVVKRRLRDAVLFARHDLLVSPPYAHIDLVSCRNLFIYLEPHAQRLGLSRLHYALTGQGVLVLGAAESVLHGEAMFGPLGGPHRLYVKKHERLRHKPVCLSPANRS